MSNIFFRGGNIFLGVLRPCAPSDDELASVSTVKHLAQICEGEKQSQLLSITSALWLWRRIRLVIHFRNKFVFSVLWNIMFQK